jgi:formate dehydrogenase maturation protein FdhE
VSEKSRLEIHDELLAEYGVSKFELALNLYFNDHSCDKASISWDYDVWEYCPVCGSKPNEKGVVLHNYYRQKSMLV